MKKYSVTAGNVKIEIEAESAQAACQEWVDGGDLDNCCTSQAVVQHLVRCKKLQPT